MLKKSEAIFLKQSKIDFTTFKRLIKYSKPYRKFLLFAFVCTLILAILTPARPFLIGKVVNDFILTNKNEPALFKWTIILTSILILEAIFQFLASLFSNLLAQSIIRDIRIKLFSHN